ncbi:hypothetical protein TREMEDRAFT_15649, partial [Tremella mesenterica DSM 1558]|uniref:uncharacterized protein n=1 Tax=Tremella mesenterica (strain ATCC 24925 / CBS 8224 / DSM 1558 / NBRC 9311 / NRRL Y-6157 / RJB 2259-6 / UBC 559-6) TaxID=578456 RepID=UPI0003F4A5D7
LPLSILLLVVVASAIETELAYYTTTVFAYNQPYFTFFLTHVTFIFIFPVHLLLLTLFQPTPWRQHLRGIRTILSTQLKVEDTWKAIFKPWTIRVIWLTILVSVPSISWFIAMVYTTAMDITAIYATSSFHAYFFSMLLLKESLSRITMASIGLASLGVVVIALAGKGDGISDEEMGIEGKDRVLGDVIMVIGAVLLGLYEVIYKMLLPETHDHNSPSSTIAYSSLPSHHAPINISPPLMNSQQFIPLSPSHNNRQISNFSDTEDLPTKISSRSSPSDLSPEYEVPTDETISEDGDFERAAKILNVATPQLPPALHANFLTSCLGLATLLLLWIPIVILDYTGVEKFRSPGSTERGWEVWLVLSIVCWGGAIYNAGLMILIGIWGPTTSSVANLLTIGLVAVLDAVWMGNIPSFQTLLGVGMICVGFGVLLYEGE